MDMKVASASHKQMHQDALDRSRAYKSRNKRPCDFCRYKKAACHLDHNPPCELCVRYGKECTFVESPAKRRRPNEDRRSSDLLLPPSSSFDISNELLSWEQSMPPFLPPLHSDFSFDPQVYEPLMFEQFDPVQAGLAPPSNPTPESLPTDASSPGEPSLDAQASCNAQLVGLSGEQDPYLLRHYRFDVNNEFTSQQIRVRRVGENSCVPVHFMIQHNKLAAKAQPADSPSNADTWRREMKEMVSDEVGRRLIQLYVEILLTVLSFIETRQLTSVLYLADSFDMFNLTSLCFHESVAHGMATMIQTASKLRCLQQYMDMLFPSVYSTISSASMYILLHHQTRCSHYRGQHASLDSTPRLLL